MCTRIPVYYPHSCLTLSETTTTLHDIIPVIPRIPLHIVTLILYLYSCVTSFRPGATKSQRFFYDAGGAIGDRNLNGWSVPLAQLSAQVPTRPLLHYVASAQEELQL